MEQVALLNLFDISQRLIVKEKSVIDFKLLRGLLDRGTKLKKNFIPFGNTKLFKNFLNIFNEEKYFTIFTPDVTNQEIVNTAKNANLTHELVEELTFIKNTLPYTFRHVLLVTALVVKIAMDLRDKDYNPQYAAIVGLLHDLGKSRIPKEILGKDTPLTQSEYAILRTHPLLSYLLISYYLGSDFISIADAARDHHEKLDGKGYPRGVSKVGKYARLITPVDIFDALITERPYRASPFTIRQAIDCLVDESNAGKIDKEVVYHLICYVRKEFPRPEELRIYPKKTPPLVADNSYGKIIPDD